MYQSFLGGFLSTRAWGSSAILAGAAGLCAGAAVRGYSSMVETLPFRIPLAVLFAQAMNTMQMTSVQARPNM